jgi:hypothetical protein
MVLGLKRRAADVSPLVSATVKQGRRAHAGSRVGFLPLGGVRGDPRGGAILVDIGRTLTVTNSTVSGNSATKGGGIYNDGGGTATVTNSTISGNSANVNGGGIYIDSGPVTLRNTIVAGNTATSANPDIRGSVAAGSNNNLIGDAGSAGGLAEGTDGNIVGNSGSGTLDINTVLNTTLADNGGPTFTHALPTGSLAIDVGSNANATDDGTPGGMR